MNKKNQKPGENILYSLEITDIDTLSSTEELLKKVRQYVDNTLETFTISEDIVNTKENDLYFKEGFTISIINLYVNLFLEKYNEAGKIDLEKLDILKESIKKLIEDKEDKDGNVLDYGVKGLYGALGDLYAGIGETKLAFENFDILYKISSKNNNLNDFLYSLERLGDLLSGIENNEAREYYLIILENLAVNKISNKDLAERIIKKYIKILDDIEDVYYYMDQLLILDEKNLLFIGEYFEELGELDNAFPNYLEALEKNIAGAKEKMLVFLEVSLKNKIEKEFNQTYNNYSKKGNLESQQSIDDININSSNIKESNKKGKLLDTIIKNFKKDGKLLREDKKEIFLSCLERNFLDELDNFSIQFFLARYSEKINNGDIYLGAILDTISGYIFDEDIKADLKNVWKKVYNKKELNNKDLTIINNVLDFKNSLERKMIYIKNKIYSGKTLNKQEEDFLFEVGSYEEIYGKKEVNYSAILEEIYRKSF